MTENLCHILIVDDDPAISMPLASFLQERGYATSISPSAEAASEVLRRNTPDLILLDVMLPGEDGLAMCRRLNTDDRPCIIMLTALSAPMDKVIGLELGADDYVSKPFDLYELLARIRAVLRRTRHRPAAPLDLAEQKLRFPGFVFVPARRYLRSTAGMRVPLTGAETDLLLVFCKRAKEVLSREELIALTRGDGFSISPRSIDLLVSRLRRKLAADGHLNDPIRTVRADGYVFHADVTSA